ncbi:MAG: DUF1643 domain-containing protein [Phycisphaeraceae bacterium]|nr:DUF1643 domain-containing protein [Phycisphaeraceae bacterium]MCW5762297.1 DUF1643 domain-containing protein [Phycisphaeraceae bacterium]
MSVPVVAGAKLMPWIGRASFDRSGRYRYALQRQWAAGGRRVCFCMLNPSTADASKNDPTVRRCIGYAQRWGFDALEVVNIFALRSTDPRGLYEAADPIGPRNDAAIVRAAERAQLLVLAWGGHGELGGRGREVVRLVSKTKSAMCLGVTQSGEPRHPLYLSQSELPMAIPSFVLEAAGAARYAG